MTAWIETELVSPEGKKRRVGRSKRSKMDSGVLKAEGWQVSGYYTGHREPGSTSKIYRRFQTFEQARAYKTEVDRQLATGAYVPQKARNETLDSFVARTLASSHDLAPSTRRGYSYTWENYVKPTLGHQTIGLLTTQQLQTFMNGVIDSQGSGTVVAVDQLLRRCMNAAVREGVLYQSPMKGVKIPKWRRKEIHPLPVETVEALADAVDPRYRAAVLLAAYGGLRGGEVGGLRLRDLNLDRGVLTINQATRTVWGKAEIAPPKTSAGRRRVTLPMFLVQELRLHVSRFVEDVEDRDSLVFTTPNNLLVHHTNLNKALKKAANSLGIPKDEQPDFHHLRHTSAALAIAAGAHPKAIQMRLGHQDIQTTLNVYGHLMEGMDQQLADDLHTARSRALSGVPVPELPAAEVDDAQED